MKENKDRLEIKEIFMAKAGKHGWNRCFHGTIKRSRDAEGNPRVFGKIKVNDTYIEATARDQWELGDKLDELVLFVLDYGLLDDDGISSMMAGTHCFLN